LCQQHVGHGLMARIELPLACARPGIEAAAPMQCQHGAPGLLARLKQPGLDRRTVQTGKTDLLRFGCAGVDGKQAQPEQASQPKDFP
jgi:hypothetical protein